MYDLHGAFSDVFTSRGGAGMLDTPPPPVKKIKKRYDDYNICWNINAMILSMQIIDIVYEYCDNRRYTITK